MDDLSLVFISIENTSSRHIFFQISINDWTVFLMILIFILFLWSFDSTCNAFSSFTNWAVLPSVFFIARSWANTWSTLPQYQRLGWGQVASCKASEASLRESIPGSSDCWYTISQVSGLQLSTPSPNLPSHDKCLLSIFYLLSRMTSLQAGLWLGHQPGRGLGLVRMWSPKLPQAFPHWVAAVYGMHLTVPLKFSWLLVFHLVLLKVSGISSGVEWMFLLSSFSV